MVDCYNSLGFFWLLVYCGPRWKSDALFGAKVGGMIYSSLGGYSICKVALSLQTAARIWRRFGGGLAAATAGTRWLLSAYLAVVLFVSRRLPWFDGRMVVAWWSHGGRMVVAWWSHGDSLAIVWRYSGGHVVVSSPSW
jgi:hypothetical protein